MAGRVWICIDYLDRYGLGQAVREGIGDYIQHVPWRYFEGISSRNLDIYVKKMQKEPPCAWLGAFADATILDVIADSGIPAVNLMHTVVQSPVPSVYNDDTAVGRLVAEHFLDKAIDHLAFFGSSQSPESMERLDGFAEFAAGRGIAVDVATTEQLGGADVDMQKLRDGLDLWVSSLPKPVGIFAANDFDAGGVTRACNRMGIGIPEEAAVVGVNNMPLTCLSGDPAISSVQLNSRRVGYEGAALIDRMIQGEPAPAEPVIIPPIGIVQRRSSDVLAIGDTDVVDALDYIRKHAFEPISVSDVLQEVPISRRMIEYKFRKYLGHSPAKEIKRAQINYVKKLLESNNWSMAKVAQASAFPDARMLSIQFKKEVGVPPSHYRRRYHKT